MNAEHGWLSLEDADRFGREAGFDPIAVAKMYHQLVYFCRSLRAHNDGVLIVTRRGDQINRAQLIQHMLSDGTGYGLHVIEGYGGWIAEYDRILVAWLAKLVATTND